MSADLETIDPRHRGRPTRETESALRLTIMAHPDPTRIGRFADLTPGPGGAAVSRLTPLFDDGEPLNDPFISRKPVVMSGTAVDARGTSTPVRVDQAKVDGGVTLDPRSLALGVVIELGEQICLLLQARPVVERAPRFDFVGDSPGLDRVRRDIALVADLDVPVLIRGPSGAGKELVARAIHMASRRRNRRWLAVNMAAIAPELAASTLFGHARGAFSGAVSDHEGHFVRANGGTLFLDEIGDTPSDVQAMLLRTLETGEVHPIGARRTTEVDVRLISATDADLDDGARFRAPLLHRLAGFRITVPPLAERRADIGPLFAHFARAELVALGSADAWRADPHDPWLPPALMATLVRHPWPGNVRQLRNVTRQLIILHRGRRTLDRWAEVLPDLLGGATAPPPTAPAPSAAPGPASTPRKRYRHVDDITDDELVEALKTHGYGLKATAEALGVSRTALYGRVDRCDRVRKASELTADEIVAAGEVHADLAERAAHLEVSTQALKRRMKALGLR